MGYTSQFVGNVVIAFLAMQFWFGIPGWLILRLTRLVPDLRRGGALFLAPWVGMCAFGMTSLPVFIGIPYTTTNLLIVYAIFCGLLLFLQRGITVEAPSNSGSASFCPIGLLSVPVGFALCLPIVPVVRDGGLYMGDQIFDHAKIAIIDSICRHGLPPVNPHYAPGDPAPLNYYFGWHFVASQVRMVTGIHSWATDAATTFATGQGIFCLVATIATLLHGRRRAGVLAGFLVMSGSVLLDSPPFELPFSLRTGVLERIRPQGFRGIAETTTWAPQHVFSAGCVVLCAFLLARLATLDHVVGRKQKLAISGLICTTAAAVFETSVWIAFGLTLIIAAVVSIRSRSILLLRQERPVSATIVLTAVPGVLILTLPMLLTMVSGRGSSMASPLSIQLFPVFGGTASVVGRFTAYWLLLVPLIYGGVLVLGVIGLSIRPKSTLWSHWYRTSSLWLAVGFLCVSQFVASVVVLNDLGWRSQLVAFVTCSVWGGAGFFWCLDFLWGKRDSSDTRRRAVAIPRAIAIVLISLGVTGVGAGLYTSPLMYEVANFVSRFETPEIMNTAGHDERQRMLRQQSAWQIVREFAGPNDVVQSNPHGFRRVTLWPTNLPFSLFSDHQEALGDPINPLVYSSRSDLKVRQITDSLMRHVFGPTPSVAVTLASNLVKCTAASAARSRSFSAGIVCCLERMRMSHRLSAKF